MRLTDKLKILDGNIKGNKNFLIFDFKLESLIYFH